MSRNLIREAAKWLHRWRRDPLLFVQEAFPWGKAGPLMNEDGPDDWQIDILSAIRDGITPDDALQIAITSGHGIGKSALVSWTILWAISTETDTRGVVTANTENQLRTKTWAEVAKWYRLSPLISALFDLTATSICSSDPAHAKTWRIDQIPWSEKKPEAFAGLHNLGRRTLVVYDEASTIPNVIWETTEGAMTDHNTERLWLCCGNPTRNTGRFRECFSGGKFQHRWQTRKIDSRTTRHTNKIQLKQWVDDYGEDSDFVRVRVRGEFPRAGSMQFISRELVDMAQDPSRDVDVTLMDPFVIGVDVARFGDDRSVICFRRGRDARTIPWLAFRGMDTMQLAAKIAELAGELKPDAIFVDGGGVGGGVVDRLRFLRQPIVEVSFGGKADRSSVGQDGAIVYANKRAEMWGTMREWLASGVLPVNDGEVAADLTGVEYGYTMLNGLDAIILEKKEDMKKRGLSSPDMGDALALTFAYPVAPTDHSQQMRGKPRHQIDYDPFANQWMTAKR